jgi:hypothetical protein
MFAGKSVWGVVDNGRGGFGQRGTVHTLATGYWILDAGYWMLDAGYWILDTGYLILDTGYLILDS